MPVLCLFERGGGVEMWVSAEGRWDRVAISPDFLQVLRPLIPGACGVAMTGWTDGSASEIRLGPPPRFLVRPNLN